MAAATFADFVGQSFLAAVRSYFSPVTRLVRFARESDRGGASARELQQLSSQVAELQKLIHNREVAVATQLIALREQHAAELKRLSESLRTIHLRVEQTANYGRDAHALTEWIQQTVVRIDRRLEESDRSISARDRQLISLIGATRILQGTAAEGRGSEEFLQSWVSKWSYGGGDKAANLPARSAVIPQGAADEIDTDFIKHLQEWARTE